MSYIFSRALVEEYLEASCSDSAPSAPSSSNPGPQAYCSPDRMTDYSRLSRFGMTYAPLTDDRGAALLTWYLEASRARTFQPQEKVPALVGRGLARVLGDLAEIGYDAEWLVLGADAVGLPHRRARLWLLAHAAGLHRHARHSLEPRGTRQSQMQPGRLPGISLYQEWKEARQGDVRVGVFRRPDDGVAPEVDELKALGNGQVPAVAATAFRVLLERFTNYNPQLTLF